VKIDWKWFLVGYLVGSFFGVSQLLGVFGGITGVVKPSGAA
jgi:hypothetical protein